MLDFIDVQKKSLSAAVNEVSSVFAVNFMPAHSKRKVKLKQMEEDSWENTVTYAGR